MHSGNVRLIGMINFVARDIHPMATVCCRIMNRLWMLGVCVRRGRRMMSCPWLTVLVWRWEIGRTAARGRAYCGCRKVWTVVGYRIGIRVGKVSSSIVGVILMRRLIFRLLHLHSMVGVNFSVHAVGARGTVVVFIDFSMGHGIGGVRVCAILGIRVPIHRSQWRLWTGRRRVGRKVNSLMTMNWVIVDGKMMLMMLHVVVRSLVEVDVQVLTWNSAR
jgi:hypothetical protein